jgi:HPt (histidine-containing phosphotransfer) domain-containing protein
MKPYIIEVSPMFKHLIPAFVERRKRDIPVFDSLIKTKDYVKLQGLCHELRGACGGYGFQVLGDVLTAMENDLKEKKYGKLQNYFEQIKDIVENHEVTYKAS